MTEQTDSGRRESAARRSLRRQGYQLRKSRACTPHLDNLGGYMILDPHINGNLAGSRFELTLEDVERWAAESA